MTRPDTFARIFGESPAASASAGRPASSPSRPVFKEAASSPLQTVRESNDAKISEQRDKVLGKAGIGDSRARAATGDNLSLSQQLSAISRSRSQQVISTIPPSPVLPAPTVSAKVPGVATSAQPAESPKQNPRILRRAASADALQPMPQNLFKKNAKPAESLDGSEPRPGKKEWGPSHSPSRSLSPTVVPGIRSLNLSRKLSELSASSAFPSFGGQHASMMMMAGSAAAPSAQESEQQAPKPGKRLFTRNEMQTSRRRLPVQGAPPAYPRFSPAQRKHFSAKTACGISPIPGEKDVACDAPAEKLYASASSDNLRDRSKAMEPDVLQPNTSKKSTLAGQKMDWQNDRFEQQWRTRQNAGQQSRDRGQMRWK